MISRRDYSTWVLFCGLLFLPACLGFSHAVAGTEQPLLFEGEFAAQDLTWQRNPDGTYSVRLPDTRPLAETDMPSLAVKSLKLLVPAHVPIAGVEVVPMATHREVLPGSLRRAGPLFPDQGAPVSVKRLEDGQSSYPVLWGEFAGDYFWRGFRFVTVLVYPLRLWRDGSSEFDSIEVLDRFGIRLLTEGGSPPADPVVRKRRVPGERQRAESLLRPLLANPDALTGYDRQDGMVVPEPQGGFQPAATPVLSGSRVSYLIITSEELRPAFQVLADYKTDQGLPAVVATVEWIENNFRQGSDIQETVRLFTREAYENWGVEYVLLGGDTAVLPCRYTTSKFWPPQGTTDIPSDLYFACLDGNWNADADFVFGEPYTSPLYPGDDADMADEVFLGRAPVSSPAMAATFVDKVISYSEMGPGEDWVNRSLSAAEVLYPSNYHPGDAIVLDGAELSEGLVNEYLLPCTGIQSTRMYETYAMTDTLGQDLYPGAVPLTKAALLDSLGTGHFGLFNQIGHGFFFNMSVGDDNIFVDDAYGLTNGDHTFLLYALNCASAAFDYSCLLERFLQNPGGGSVVSIGSSRAAFVDPANFFQEEFYNQLYCQPSFRGGEAFSLGRLPFLGNTFYNTAERWTFQCYTYLGDPSLGIWTQPVEAVEVTAPGSLQAGYQTVVVQVAHDGGSPVAGALVCLNKEGDDYATGVTDAAGTVELDITPTSGGTARLTVTGANLQLTQTDIPVSAGSTYISVGGVFIVDDGTHGSAGNGNWAVEAGETVALFLECQDTGGGGAEDCFATMFTMSPGVTVLDGFATVGDVPPGGIRVSSQAFLVRFATSLVDGQLADFNIVVNTDGGGTQYPNEWTATVLAPEIEPVEVVWSDGTTGNGNGVIDNGEVVTVQVTVKNYGAGLGDLVNATLRSADPEITLVDSTVSYSDIPLLGSSTGGGIFSLADADASSPGWSWILFEDNHGRTFRHDFRLQAPSMAEGLEANTSQGPDVISLLWLPVREPGMRGYNVYRSAQETGPFQRVNEDLIDGVSYYRDDGLGLLTRYFYFITAVDSSLVEGPPTDVVVHSTAPPEMSGFPLPLGAETSSHLAVADVDGDEVQDIILGVDQVYALRADGNELWDGDSDPQTHGPFTDLSGEFKPCGITLAELDGQPGYEIIASHQSPNQIHIFRGDGSALPGWPQALQTVNNGWNWATPAVGDVDGDGDPEIVVNTLDGRTWVWHTDGTELTDGDSDPTTNGVFLRRTTSGGWDISAPALFDLDGDGAKEIIFGTRYWAAYENFLVAYRYDGTPPAGWPYSVGIGGSGNFNGIQCSPTVADLDGDESAEIIFITENDLLYVVCQDGTDFPHFPIPFTANNSNHTCPSPAVGNFDDDDDLEIVAVATEDGLLAHIFVLDTDVDGGTSGLPLPGWPRPVEGSTESSPVVGDIDGDRVADILHGIGGGDEESPNLLYGFKADGEYVDGFPISLAGPIRGTPTICDVDLDGDVDIAYGGWDLQLHVWDMPYPHRPHLVPWPTHRGNVQRDGVYRAAGAAPVPDLPAEASLMLGQPFPNPFNPVTRVRLFLPGEAGSPVTLDVGIFNIQGRRVRTLQQGPVSPGWHTWIWDGLDGAGRGQPSGTYLLRAQSAGQVASRKISLVK